MEVGALSELTDRKEIKPVKPGFFLNLKFTFMYEFIKPCTIGGVNPSNIAKKQTRVEQLIKANPALLGKIFKIRDEQKPSEQPFTNAANPPELVEELENKLESKGRAKK